MKALAALANTRGGTLWIGIKEDGSVIGWSNGAAALFECGMPAALKACRTRFFNRQRRLLR